MYFNAIFRYLVFFSHEIRCNKNPPSKTNFSVSLQIIAALDLLLTKSAMSLARGGLSAFCIKLVDSNRAGGYTHTSYPLLSSKLIFETFAKITNLWNNRYESIVSSLPVKLTDVFVDKVLTFSLRFKLYLKTSFLSIFSPIVFLNMIELF